MKKTLGIGIICVIIGLVLFAFVAGDFFNLLFRKVNINDKRFDSYESGEIAEGDLRFVMAKLGTATESKRIFGIPVADAEAEFYLISDNGGYVVIDVREGAESFDSLLEQTAKYISEQGDEPAQGERFIGKAVEITDEQLALVSAHFEAQNLKPEDWQLAISSLVLVQLDTTFIVIQLCISFAFILIGAILLLLSRRYRFGETVFVGEMTPEEAAEQQQRREELAEKAAAAADDSEQNGQEQSD